MNRLTKSLAIIGLILSLFLFSGCSEDDRSKFCKEKGYNDWDALNPQLNYNIYKKGYFTCYDACDGDVKTNNLTVYTQEDLDLFISNNNDCNNKPDCGCD